MNKKTKANLNKKSFIEFLIKLMKDIKKNYKNIGIVTDKDGTVILNNDLAKTLKQIKKSRGLNVWIIANSGRTVGDMLETIKKENMPEDCFDYVIGDNGGMAIRVRNKQELFKHIMEESKIKSIINEFMQNGGTLPNIRLANGSNIIAYKDRQVKKYYKKRDNVLFFKNIKQINAQDITKVTLTGSEKQIKGIVKYINENLKEYETHEGKTTFPSEKCGNYRVDCTNKNNKGQAMQYMIDKLKLDRCIVLGNDLNDLSMFKLAIKRGDHIVVANNEYPEITEQIVGRLKEYCKLEKINWEKSNVLVLEDKNVNKFLEKVSMIFGIINKEGDFRKNFMNKIRHKQEANQLDSEIKSYITRFNRKER